MAGSKPGERRGGRQKGAKNKRTLAIDALIEEKYPGFNPVEAMIAIYHDKTVPLEYRLAMLKESAQYVLPKRKALEMSGNLTSVVKIRDLSSNG